MWTWLKTSLSNTWGWIKAVALKFHNWVKAIAPGLKIYLTTGLGSVGSLAAMLQEYVTGVPLDKFVGATEALIITTVLFSLAFWFRTMVPKAAATDA